MGRAFEYRKARKLKRWGNMSKTFTRIGKEITIAVKASGPDPANNPRLRTLIQNARSENMPKDTIERAIKKATDKDAKDYKELTYEGYGPHGIAIFVEAATDNNTRTVANVRSIFTKHGGSLGTQGSLTFLFDHKVVLKIAAKPDVELEDLELELIDCGVEEVEPDDEGNIILTGAFEDSANIQSYLEKNGYEILSTEFVRIPNDLKVLPPDQRESIEKILEKLEEDDDVTQVFHNMKEEDEDPSE